MTPPAPRAVAKPTASPDIDAELLAEISRRYYLEDVSKVDIARSLGLSRFKVARLLEAARATGIVRISVAVPGAVDQSLSAALADRLGLNRCVVLDTTGSDIVGARHQVAAAAAGMLRSIVKEGDLLGLSWSRAVDAMVDTLVNTSAELPRCTVVQVAGSLPTPSGGPATVDLVQRVARLVGGVAHAVHAPLVVDDATVATALRRQPGIRDTLQLVDGLDVSVVAVGAWRPGCSTVWDAVSPAVRQAGVRGGAVAEVTGRLLAADGDPVVSPLDDLVIGASLEQLRRPAERVAIVSGPHRVPATLAAARGGLVTVLVTTGDIARGVLSTQAAP